MAKFKIQNGSNYENTFVTTYLESHLSSKAEDRENLWQLFQLLSFLQSFRNFENSPNVKKIEGKQIYYEITFQLHEFVEFLGGKAKSLSTKKGQNSFNDFLQFSKDSKSDNASCRNFVPKFCGFSLLRGRKDGKTQSMDGLVIHGGRLLLLSIPFWFSNGICQV